MRPLTDLCKLAIKYSSDRGGRHNTYNHAPCHGTHEYTPTYFAMFSHQRLRVRSVLEIGINKGCGLRMWREFFPNAIITGLDIDHACLLNEERIQSFVCDQGDAHALGNVLQKAQAHPFDIIIDDGSHNMMDQVASLNVLAPLLTDIGIYVIEDIPRDHTWLDYLLKHTPECLHPGVIYPPLGTGEMWPEALYIATKE